MERLQFITNGADSEEVIAEVAKVLEGGCRWVQLRMKEASDQEFLTMACRLRSMTAVYGAKLILDDHVEAVVASGAEGVHLGKNDMPVADARRLLGEDVIIGATANNYEDLIKAVNSGADYIGLGPFRFTKTKKNLSPILGLDGYIALMTRFHKEEHILPVVAIGGIETDDIKAIMATSVDGIAVSGAIIKAPDSVGRTREILEILENDQYNC